jgi:hypothetical protein
MAEILLSDGALVLYGMLFWQIVGVFFPGVNPVVKRIIQAINQAPIDNEVITTTAEEQTKSSSKSSVSKILAGGVLQKLAAAYLKKKLL